MLQAHRSGRAVKGHLLLVGIAGLNSAGELMPVSCECCVLTGRGLCDELITRPEESYRLWCVDR